MKPLMQFKMPWIKVQQIADCNSALVCDDFLVDK